MLYIHLHSSNQIDRKKDARHRCMPVCINYQLIDCIYLASNQLIQ